MLKVEKFPISELFVIITREGQLFQQVTEKDLIPKSYILRVKRKELDEAFKISHTAVLCSVEEINKEKGILFLRDGSKLIELSVTEICRTDLQDPPDNIYMVKAPAYSK